MSPAAEKPLKICIRGLPANTDHRKLHKDLRERGFDPIFMRQVPARDKGPGIFCVQLQLTPKISTVYEVKKLLDVPVKVEVWRGRQGPPQCQRCQGFRHSAAECLREYRCVHCARPHPSKNCNRPYDIPTCANCSGSHAANDLSCPAMRREEIAKKGMVLRTSGYTLATPNPVDESNAPSSLMAEANANWLSSQRKRRRRKTKAKDTLVSVSPDRSQSPLKEQEAQALPAPVMKKSEPVSNEIRKPADPIINKPQPVPKVVQEAPTKYKSTKESQQVSKNTQAREVSPLVKEKSQIPVQKAQLIVDSIIKKKSQSIAQQAQQPTAKLIRLEDVKPIELTTRPDLVRTNVVRECVLVLSSVLSAIQEGHNPVPIILEGIAGLYQGA